MLRTPKTLKVWGHNIEIVKEKDPTVNHDGRVLHVLGQACYDDNKIRLKDKLPNSKEAETLIHELLHWIGYQSNTFRGLDGKVEERIVDNTANGLYLVLKDNPKFIDYLKESFNG